MFLTQNPRDVKIYWQNLKATDVKRAWFLCYMETEGREVRANPFPVTLVHEIKVFQLLLPQIRRENGPVIRSFVIVAKTARFTRQV